MSEYDHLGEEETPPEPPPRKTTGQAPRTVMTPDQVASHGKPWAELHGEEREQAIRDYYGYTASEKRTEAERAAAAELMKAKGKLDAYEGELPPDIEAVWGEGRIDGMQQPAHLTARVLIAAWGMDSFRNSAIHIAAIKENARDSKMELLRAAYVKAKKEKA